MPNLRVLGPRLGPKVREVKAALERGEAEELGAGRVRVAGVELDADDVIRGERVEIAGWAIADDVTLSVALDTEIDPSSSSEAGSMSSSTRSTQCGRMPGSS